MGDTKKGSPRKPASKSPGEPVLRRRTGKAAHPTVEAPSPETVKSAGSPSKKASEGAEKIDGSSVPTGQTRKMKDPETPKKTTARKTSVKKTGRL